MLKQIKFKNGNTYDTITVISTGSQFIQGQSRACIDVQFTEDKFDIIKAEISIEGNTDEITIIDDANQWVHTNYSIRQSLGITSVETATATDTAPAVTESRTSLVLAQLTYSEVKINQLQSTVDALVLASLGV